MQALNNIFVSVKEKDDKKSMGRKLRNEGLFFLIIIYKLGNGEGMFSCKESQHLSIRIKF